MFARSLVTLQAVRAMKIGTKPASKESRVRDVKRERFSSMLLSLWLPLCLKLAREVYESINA